MSGPAIRAAVDAHQRELFEAEFRTALVAVTRTFDVDQLAEVVRRWWVLVGGDPSVAERDRGAAGRAAQLSERDWGYPRPPYVPRTIVNRTGPAVYAALDNAARVEFEAQFERALVEAATTFDHRPASRVVSQWWAVAVTLANPTDRDQDRETARRVEAGEITQFVYH
jgi:Family of unknown function (DUF6247)